MLIDSKTIMHSGSKKALGNDGEAFVEKYLIEQGYIIRKKNYRLRNGEIDLIAEKDSVICFVEVKTRATDYFATSTIITPAKQATLIRTALSYIALSHLPPSIYRFDVAFLQPMPGNSFKISYIENAFSSETFFG